MKPLSGEEIRQAVGGRWLSGGKDVTVTSAATDSRHAKTGDVFIALRGERFDAHDYLPQVAAAGCELAIVREDYNSPGDLKSLGLIGVADTGKALEELGAYHRGLVPARVLAITGSNGKTTVKRMIHHVLARHFRGTCSPKSFNNNIGLPLTLLGVNPGDQFVVCEVGSNAPGEIATLAEICRPDVAVITSIGPTHLEKLGSIEGVAAEKASILGHLRSGGQAIVWGDSPVLDQALAKFPVKTVRFGRGEKNDLRLTAVEPAGEFAQRFQINGKLWATLPMAGEHMACNALAAIAAAMTMGLSLETAAADLADFPAVEGRLERLECGSVTVINDAYNANPASVLAAADVMASSSGARRVMIVGDMRELGPQSQQWHEETGQKIAARGVDLLIGVGTLGRCIAMAACRRGATAKWFDTVEQAAAGVPAMLAPGDLVLIKGSRAMAMERLIAPIRDAFETKE